MHSQLCGEESLTNPDVYDSERLQNGGPWRMNHATQNPLSLAETASELWSGSIQSDVDAKWTIHPCFIFQPLD